MNSEVNQNNKALVWAFWNAIDSVDDAKLPTLFEQHIEPDAPWFGPQPIGDLAGTQAVIDDVLIPLRAAFEDCHRDSFIFLGGESRGRADGEGTEGDWVGATGVYRGRFVEPLLGIPPTGEPATLRFGEFVRMVDGRIVETYVLYDYIDLMQQAGCSALPPSRGRPGLYPPPAAGDGVLLDEQDADHSARSLEHIRQFIYGALNAYDEHNLASMGMAGFFEPDIAWYGPAGIGACLSLEDFQVNHQAPWLHAFPDRRVQDLTALIAEGDYTGSPGWAGVRASHQGEYLGVAATGRPLAVNGLDFWKRSGDRFIENWVFVDMIHLFGQMGVDLMARLRDGR